MTIKIEHREEYVDGELKFDKFTITKYEQRLELNADGNVRPKEMQYVDSMTISAEDIPLLRDKLNELKLD